MFAAKDFCVVSVTETRNWKGNRVGEQLSTHPSPPQKSSFFVGGSD